MSPRWKNTGGSAGRMKLMKKQREVQELLSQYNEQLLTCVKKTQETIMAYCTDKDRDMLAQGFQNVHRAEGKADDLRRDIEVLMYTKALFPESRGDIMGLIETMDRIPNQAESAVRMILNQHVPIPEDLVAGIREILETSCRCVEEVVSAAGSLFNNFHNATTYVGKIDQMESDVDHLEEHLIDRIFSSDEEGYIKILLRDLARKLASISDRAENVGDRIRIIVAKRSI